MQEGRGITASVATVIAAVCGLLGAVAGAGIKSYYDQETALELERLKFQADLILQAIDTEDQDTAIKTLKFFANAGLIPSYEAKVLALTEADEGAAVPTLRPSPGPYRPLVGLPASSEAVRTAAAVGLFTVGGQGVCTTFFIGEDRVLVPGFCLRDSLSSDGPGLERLTITLDYDSDDAATRDVRVIALEEENVAGLAVLRTEPANGSVTPLSLRPRRPVPGEPVYMVHHPAAGPKQLSADCTLDPERPVAPATAVGLGDQERPMLHFSCRSEGGSAGAPVIATSDGAVLGVHTAGTTEGFDQYAVPTLEIVRGSDSLRQQVR